MESSETTSLVSDTTTSEQINGEIPPEMEIPARNEPSLPLVWSQDAPLLVIKLVFP